jgi:hypothetical protein
MPHIELAQADSPRWSLITFGVLLLAVIMVIWGVPWFVSRTGLHTSTSP